MDRNNTYVVHDALTALLSTTLVLVGLKLLDLIDWSWWGVFAPALLLPCLVALCLLYFTVVITSVIVRLAIESLVERFWK